MYLGIQSMWVYSYAGIQVCGYIGLWVFRYVGI